MRNPILSGADSFAADEKTWYTSMAYMSLNLL